MSRLAITSQQLSELRSELLKHTEESCAILFARPAVVDGELTRLVVRDVFYPPDSAYTERSDVRAKLDPSTVAQAAARARTSGESIVFVHTHPFPFNRFSEIDDAGEDVLREFLDTRLPGSFNAALLLTPEVSIARMLGLQSPLRVIAGGPQMAWGAMPEAHDTDERFDRQIRAFGEAGQRLLGSMRIGIVGLGGTGSVVAQQLAHLGVTQFHVLDPDRVEETNLNRLVGSRPSDVGRPKVRVAAEMIRSIQPTVSIVEDQGSVLVRSVAKTLSDVDFIFCCTDSHGSRAVLNQLAYQYCVPTIDMGVVLNVINGQLAHIAARVQLLAPGLPCLVCGNALNSEQVRRDLMTDFERQQDPYIIGAQEPAPSVITLNSVAASIATTMFLSVAVGAPGTSRYVNYNGITGAARSVVGAQGPTCIVCSARGAVCRADEWPLAARSG